MIMPKKIAQPNFFIFATQRSGSTMLCGMLSNNNEVYCLNDCFIFDIYVCTKGFRNISQSNNYWKYKALSRIKPLPSNQYIINVNEAKKYYSNLIERYERNDWMKKYTKMLDVSGIVSKLQTSEMSLVELFNITYSFLLNSEQQNKKIFGEKTPDHLYISSWIKNLYPEAKFITLIRNPITNIAAIYKRGRDLKKSLQIYLKAYKNRFRHLYEGEETLVITYENLINKPKETLACIYKHIGANPENISIKFNDPRVSEASVETYTGNMLDPERDLKLRRIFNEKQITLIKKRCKSVFEKFYPDEL